jgi:alkanesulfonate monooxygenase SsuD/methylene tetrahydromethanopterin reductase-like flavin-dependent oxidoreductase (luciferase family)
VRSINTTAPVGKAFGQIVEDAGSHQEWEAHLMRFAISTPNMGPVRDLIELAREANEAGWDGLFVWDHLQFDRQRLLQIHDPWVLLGAMAPYATRLLLGPMVTPVARRRPWVLAKQVVTLDQLTDGRAVLGVGLGAPSHEEFGAFGEPVDDTERAARLDEGLEVITALWTGDEVHHHGEHYRLDAQMHPLPVQQPRPPVWVAGMWPNRKPFERAARWDGVYAIDAQGEALTPEVIAKVVAITGRRPGFEVVTTAHDRIPAHEFEEAGATWVVHSTWPTDGFLDTLRGIARQGPPR